MRLALLAAEFGLVFVAIPLLIYDRRLPNLPIPILLAAALVAFFILCRDPNFQIAQLVSLKNILPYLPALLLRDTVLLAALGSATYFFAPDLLFSFVKRSPSFWALVMVLYPLLSVFPQELLYRAFFFHRYQTLFGNGWALFMVSALAFGFVHIIFGHWLSVILCVIGGLLFALTYHSSGSLLLACIDHAIFGNFIFTIGLGKFFYHDSRL